MEEVKTLENGYMLKIIAGLFAIYKKEKVVKVII